MESSASRKFPKAIRWLQDKSLPCWFEGWNWFCERELLDKYRNTDQPSCSHHACHWRDSGKQNYSSSPTFSNFVHILTDFCKKTTCYRQVCIVLKRGHQLLKASRSVFCKFLYRSLPLCVNLSFRSDTVWKSNYVEPVAKFLKERFASDRNDSFLSRSWKLL